MFPSCDVTDSPSLKVSSTCVFARIPPVWNFPVHFYCCECFVLWICNKIWNNLVNYIRLKSQSINGRLFWMFSIIFWHFIDQTTDLGKDFRLINNEKNHLSCSLWSDNILSCNTWVMLHVDDFTQCVLHLFSEQKRLFCSYLVFMFSPTSSDFMK